MINSNLAFYPRSASALPIGSQANNILLFSSLHQKVENKGPAKTQNGIGFKLTGLLAAATAILMPSVAGAQVASQGGQHPGINEAQIQQVNKANDLPFLNRDLKQPVVDLINNPLLKPETKTQLNQLLNDLNSSGKAQMALVIIPDTANRELNTLATDLFNQIGIGQAGQNNGLLFLVNANAARENRDHGKMFIMPGAGLKYQFATGEAAKIIRDVGLPHLRNNDPDAAVKAVTEHLVNKLHAQRAAQQNFVGQNQANKGPEWTTTDIIATVAVVIVALCILALLIAIIAKGDGYSSGGGSWSSGSSGGYSGGSGWSSGDSGGGGSWSSSSDFGGGVSDGGGGGGD